MEPVCQEAVMRVPLATLRLVLDSYLTRHGFCSDCGKMVNRAYDFLVTGEDNYQPKKKSCCESVCSASSSPSSSSTEIVKAKDKKRGYADLFQERGILVIDDVS